MITTHTRRRPTLGLALAASLATTLALGACGTTASGGGASDRTEGVTGYSAAHDDEELHPRVVLAHEGGLSIIDAGSGKVIVTEPSESFLRLNPAGDGRHVVVTDGDVFRVLDAGIHAEPHGDHAHLEAGDPRMTEVTYPAAKAGHVVVHAGHTTLFSDGTGEITVVESDEVATRDAATEHARTQEAHHGVALRLADGGLLTTQGTSESRSTVQYLVKDSVRAETTDCPDVHGEATAQPDPSGDVAVFGCAEGPVVFRGGAFHKVAAGESGARIGTLAGHPESPVVLGDYKVGKDAKPQDATRVSLIDTRANTMRVVDLGSPHWFRSFARGPHGEGLVLTGDGSLHVIDVTTGEVTRKLPVVGAWERGSDWKQPGPIVQVAGTRAYVTDAAAKQLVVIDLEKVEEVARHTLTVTPTEMTVVTGYAEGTEPHHHD